MAWRGQTVKVVGDATTTPQASSSDIASASDARLLRSARVTLPTGFTTASAHGLLRFLQFGTARDDEGPQTKVGRAFDGQISQRKKYGFILSVDGAHTTHNVRRELRAPATIQSAQIVDDTASETR